MLPLGRFAGLLDARSRSRFLLQFELERYRAGVQRIAMRQDRHPLHHIPQLARIARPLVLLERLPDFGLEALPAEAIADAEVVEEVLGHGADVLQPLPQSRYPDRHHAHSIVQVLAELALPD